ncbi:MAG: acyl-CoA mutase large subunit family protein [Deltaproteobacteria bacterium]|nr:acyl-CoA mutase large subunit family protein [Deltaproteobacteria bacterium]MBW1819076.1 acyl-CoA mutase large subunit family protein [Deltaproteobacteria bacterium]
MHDKTVSMDRKFGHMVRTATQSHIELKSFYGPDDCGDVSYEGDLGNPGEYPFTRGLYPDMYRDRLWLKSFIVSYSTPEETNEAFKRYIADGMTDLRLLADLPTQSGIDPDHPFAWNSMMCGGVATYAINVYERMLQGLPMESVVCELAHSSISNFIYFYALLVALMENRGLDVTRLRGNSINDPVRAKLVYASPDFPTDIARRVCLDHIEYSVGHTPKWRPFAPNGVDPCQGGMDAVRELGGCLAVATAICLGMRDRGISLDDYGAMVFSLDAESDFFETIAKFRAARMMWAKIAKEKLGAKSKKAMQLKIGIRTSGLSLQSQKPLNNAARVTLQILSCILGGVNSLDASSMDEAIGLPSYEARVFNLDAQHIITHEANVPLVADPLGGSYFMESLTNRMVKGVEGYLAEIEDKGGIFECLESGWLNDVMEANRLKVQREKAEGERLIVGVNAFQQEGEEGPINSAIRNVAYKTPTVALREQRVREVMEFKEGRDKTALRSRLRDIHTAAREGGNLTRPIIEAAKLGATLGEVTGLIRLGYGIPYDPFEQIDTPPLIEQSIAGEE